MIPDATVQRIVLVSGPSGAGRSTAVNALEDCGYEVIDNIPLSLIPRLIEGSRPLTRPMALGVDVRNRDFSVRSLLDLHAQLNGSDLQGDLLYLDCTADVLARRYSETRRRHPLAPDDTPAEGIALELALLDDVRSHADVLIDTTDLTVHDLRAEVQTWFTIAQDRRLAISAQSFSYKRGLPQSLDTVFDVRFLRNPHWEPELRAHTGLDDRVQRFIARDERHDGFLQRVTEFLNFVLPAHIDEGKTHFSIGFGCTGGQHRSVAVTETVAHRLAEHGWQVSIRHRELDRRGLIAAPRPGNPAAERQAT